MTELRDRLPELLTVMRQRHRRMKVLRTALACSLLAAASTLAWLAAPSRPVRRETPQVATSTPPDQPPVNIARTPATSVRIVSTEQVLATTHVEVRTIAPNALAKALAQKTPCYSFLRIGESQRLIYSCR